MAFQTIKKSSLPVSTRGQASTEPKVAIRENGQIAFNKLAAEAMDTPKILIIQFDPEKRLLVFRPYFSGKSPVPKGVSKEDYEKDLFTISYGNKTAIESPYFAGAQLLKDLEYDYITSGNQNFIPQVVVKDKALVITLPKGSLEAKPKTPRKPKDPSKKNGPVVSVPVPKGKASDIAADDTEGIEEFDLTT